jgi:hypothetical protein
MSEVKAVKEVVSAALVVGVAVAKQLKDGLQVGKDAVALVDELLQEENRSKLVAAVQDVSQVLPELKALDLAGWLQLGVDVVPSVVAAVQAARA